MKEYIGVGYNKRDNIIMRTRVITNEITALGCLRHFYKGPKKVFIVSDGLCTDLYMLSLEVENWLLGLGCKDHLLLTEGLCNEILLEMQQEF